MGSVFVLDEFRIGESLCKVRRGLELFIRAAIRNVNKLVEDNLQARTNKFEIAAATPLDPTNFSSGLP